MALLREFPDVDCDVLRYSADRMVSVMVNLYGRGYATQPVSIWSSIDQMIQEVRDIIAEANKQLKADREYTNSLEARYHRFCEPASVSYTLGTVQSDLSELDLSELKPFSD
jgi:hypothetical protein